MKSWTQFETRASDAATFVTRRMSPFVKGGLGLVMAMTLISCGAKEPSQISVSGIPYNYTDQTVFRVSVNGQGIRLLMDAVNPGGVSGGGVVCCIQIPVGATEAQVEVDLGSTKYTTRAKIEKWWPDLAHYTVVHVLPGKKVVIEVRSVDTWPRQDLMDQQLTTVGLTKQVKFSGSMNTGPMERADGVK